MTAPARVSPRLEPRLPGVSKPIQYVGGELNSVVKDWDCGAQAETPGETVRWALEEADRAGELRADAPVEEIVRSTAAIMDGLQIQWLVTGQSFSMAESFAAYADMLRHRWGTPPAA